MTDYPHRLIPTFQAIGITAPAIYSAICYSYSRITMATLLSTSPSEKQLAKQWYHAYALGPSFVPPLIISGTLSNLLLAYVNTAANSISRSANTLAALCVASIIPMTLAYMEPGVNGAGKWKAASLLRDEGFELEDNGTASPGVDRQSASEATKKWADEVEMRTIVETWIRLNMWRCWIGALAVGTSSYAMTLSS
ncbi:uncharacterized protein BDZ99DRAFT_450751 [Mytilinidion resinicola]|uniref:DUF1772-domain-containing protein n=1 Tax=Mytilinidion resinicola TaxID=574789 RepID=A0A6A6YAN7_9PEZI|nr:uncharacterized protein BDZ99DRAFT_450751 [Mytilinidion resinicola]KAF2805175.1 hypothetical protein BDZ99DRAFT_450751 [Mytilinidion resinicola]